MSEGLVAITSGLTPEDKGRLDRELIFNGIGGLLTTLFLASTILLFAFLQLISAGDYSEWSDSDCRSPSSTQHFLQIALPSVQVNIVVIQICCSVLLVQMVFQMGGLVVTYWHRQMVVLISGILYILFTVLLCLMSYSIYLFVLTKFPNAPTDPVCSAVADASPSVTFWSITGGRIEWFWMALAGNLLVFVWASCVVGPAQFRFKGDSI